MGELRCQPFLNFVTIENVPPSCLVQQECVGCGCWLLGGACASLCLPVGRQGQSLGHLQPPDRQGSQNERLAAAEATMGGIGGGKTRKGGRAGLFYFLLGYILRQDSTLLNCLDC